MSVTLARFRNGKTGYRHLNALIAAIESAINGSWPSSVALASVTGLQAALDKAPYTTLAIANTGTPDGVAHVTGQVKDAEGNSLSGRFLVSVFLGSAAYGDPVDLGTATALTNSRILKADTADALLRVLTHSDGSWGVELDTAVDGTVHAHAAVSGTFATANVAITGNP
jgi:hypothetical protein